MQRDRWTYLMPLGIIFILGLVVLYFGWMHEPSNQTKEPVSFREGEIIRSTPSLSFTPKSGLQQTAARPQRTPSGGAEIQGRVTNRENQPLPGVLVRLYERLAPATGQLSHLFQAASSRPGRQVAATHTDADGRYLLAGLSPGSYVVTVDQPGYARTGGEVLRVGPEEVRTRIDFEMQKGVRIVGRVLDSAGQRVEGARLSPRLIQPEDYRLGGVWDIFETAISDATGQFIMGGLVPGRYEVRIDAPGYATRVLEIPTDGVVQDIVLQRGVVLRGRVLDPEGRPASRAWVQAVQKEKGGGPEDFDYLLAEPFQTNNYGYFTIARFPSPEESDRMLLSVLWPGARLLLHPVEPEDYTADSLVLQLPPGEILSGTVRDEKGRPLDGVKVSVFRLRNAAGEGISPLFRPWLPVETNRAGRFEVIGLEPGLAGLQLERPGYVRKNLTDVPIPSEDLAITLHSGGVISGRVVKADASDEGAPGVQVRASAQQTGGLMDRIQPQSVETQQDGRFIFEGLKPGEYVLSAGGMLSGESSEVRVRLATEEIISNIILFYEEEKGFQGRVVERQTGQPISNVKVMILQGRRHRSLETDREGYFEFPRLLPGVWEIGFYADNYIPLKPGSRPELELEVSEEGLNRSRTFYLDRGAIVQGRVVDAKEKPLKGAVIQTGEIEGNQKESGSIPFTSVAARSRGTGDFQLAGIQPEVDFQVRISRLGHADEVRGPFRLSSGQKVDLGEIQLNRGSVIQGWIKGFEGENLTGTAEFEGRQTRIRTSGEFTLKDVPVGEGTLRVKVEGHSEVRLPVRVEPGDGQPAVEVVLDGTPER